MKRFALTMIAALFATTGVSHAAQLLVLNKSDATLAFIDPASGKTLATAPTGNGPHEIELSSDGRLAYVSDYGASTAGNTLSVIDVQTQKPLQRIDLGALRRPHGLAIAQGKVYFTAEDSRRIGRYDPDSRRVDWTFDTEQDRTHMVIATRDGTKLFASNMDSNTISVLERSAQGDWQQRLIAVGEGPEALDLSPDGAVLWTAHSRDGGISIIDVASGKVVGSLDAKTKRSNRLKFTPNGKWVLISDLGAGELVVVDAATRAQKARIAVGRSPTGILIPDNEHAYVAVSGENRIAVIDLDKLRISKTIPAGNNPDGMAWVR